MKEIQKGNLLELFGIPIYVSEKLYEFTKEELNFIKEQKNISYQNVGGNLLTKNSYVLETTELKNLKRFFLENLHFFAYEIIQINKDLDIYITQSWINFNESNTFHHQHKHVNSLFSAVLFIQGSNDCPIYFYSDKSHFGNILSETDFFKKNSTNCLKTGISNETGRLLLFPSTLHHSVEVNQNKEERVSLSFNTFVRGNLGNSYNSLTKLELK